MRLPFGNKEVRKFKVAVTSDCVLRCKYCLIDKAARETISPDCAVEAVRCFLASPGDVKKLEIYGGEPFLKFGLVKDICRSVLALSREAKKELSISLATNGVLLEREHLEFLKENNIHLSISISGSSDSHDAYRVFPNGKGSFDRVVKNLPDAFDILGKRAVDALFCVHPQKAYRMFEDFRNLVSLGFENINVECVHGFPWSEKNLDDFISDIKKIGEYVFSEIRAGRYILIETFLSSLGRESLAKDKSSDVDISDKSSDVYQEILRRRTDVSDMCPFWCDLEVYPNGEYSLYPFAFVDGLGRRPMVAVGNVKDGLIPRYRDCRFDASNPQCQGCTREYYRLPRISDGNIPYMKRTEMFKRMMKTIILKSKESSRFKDYVRETVVRSRMGYR